MEAEYVDKRILDLALKQRDDERARSLRYVAALMRAKAAAERVSRAAALEILNHALDNDGA